jgi:hypothetical protein
MTDTATTEAPSLTNDCDVCGWENRSGRPSALGSHKLNMHGIRGAKRQKQRADTAPPSVTVNLPNTRAPKGDPELQAVEDRARMLVELLSAVVLMAGQPDDALDIQRGAPAVAKAARELAQYEEWLKKLAAGGETSGRVMAWVGLLTTLAAIVLPIMARHGALPDAIAQVFGQVAATVETMTDSPASDPDDATAAA